MGRNPCCVKEEVKRGAWSAQEDQILTNYIKVHGAGKWRSLPEKAGLKRCGKSCRLRWLNYLRPDIRRGDISMEEEDLIIRLHRLLGNRWALIAGRLPGRTDNEIKNYWNTILVKKLNGNTSRPSTIPFKSQEKKTVENKSPQCDISPKEEENLTNKNVGNICNGHISTSSFPVDEDSLNFLTEFNIDEVLTQDVFNSNFTQIHCHDVHENGYNMVGGDDICASSSVCFFSEEEISLENGTKCDLIQPTLELELEKVASFLDLEDEWKEL